MRLYSTRSSPSPGFGPCPERGLGHDRLSSARLSEPRAGGDDLLLPDRGRTRRARDRLPDVIADQAAVAVQTARLFAELQGKAAPKSGSGLRASCTTPCRRRSSGSGLARGPPGPSSIAIPPKAAEPLDFVITLAEAGLTEMRALIFELRPDALETEGLVRLLDHQAAVLRTRHGLHVEIDFGPEPQASLPTKRCCTGSRRKPCTTPPSTHGPQRSRSRYTSSRRASSSR